MGSAVVKTFNTNSDRDIFIGSDGRLSIATDLQAVLKGCESATYAQLGEMVLATKLGIPNLEAIWIGVPNYPLFELYLRNTILAVQGVTGVKSIEISVRGNVLSYTANIVTVFGAGVFSGSISQGG